MTETISTLTTHLSLALADHAGHGDHGPWRGDDGPPFWPVFPLLWLLTIAAVATTAIIVGRRARARGVRCSGEARLAERYAAGEIDDEEYRTRRAVLREKA